MRYQTKRTECRSKHEPGAATLGLQASGRSNAASELKPESLLGGIDGLGLGLLAARQYLAMENAATS